MDVPLSACDGADEEALVPMPAAGLSEWMLPWAVVGPFGRASSVGAHRAMLAFSFVTCSAVNFAVASLVSSLPNCGGTFVEIMLCLTISAFSVALLQHKTWEALYLQNDEVSFIHELLHSEVRLETAKSMRKWKKNSVKQAKATAVPLAMGPLLTFVAPVPVAFHIWDDRALTPAQLCALGVGLLGLPLWVNTGPTMGMLADVLCSAMADRVRQITASVHAATPASADYQRLIREIRGAHEDIGRLTEFMQPFFIIYVVGRTGFLTLAFAIVGFGPRSIVPAWHWWTAHHVYFFFVFLTGLFSVLAVYFLTTGAKITSACQELGEAINELRATGKARDDVTVATPEQTAEINNLCYYLAGKNRGQGMGLALKRKKITYTLVLDSALAVASAVVVTFPLLLGMAGVEDAEQALENETLALGPCIRKCML